uniref:S-layer protein domain-containing protein n=1 Tax=Methanolobus psychrotolerans TaxID=1874706 RepID=UPI001F5CFA8D|nr:S-layer protein domain-containing protein [Methanolobus psychrotolerans]
MRNKNISNLSVLLIAMLIMLSSTAMAANNSTGNRIWDADENLSLDYTWTALSYSGFYFDLDSGEGSETLTIKLDSNSDRSIGAGDLKYSTAPIATSFEQGDWGSYQVIGFMAERYFAGYTDTTEFADDDVSLISDGILTKVLLDDDEKLSLYSGSSLVLEEGYELNIVEVDLNGNSVMVTLEKDGTSVDTDILSSGDNYVYATEIGTDDEVPIIAVRFSSIFQGRETTAVFVEGVFQISEDYVEVESGDSFGRMEITSLSSDEITMENSGSVSLGRGNTITIMGKLKFMVADDSTLRFGPVVDMSKPGIYELRGTVAENEKLKWTPMNFEGFYYNIDEGIGTESLDITDITGRTINRGDLLYTSKPLDVNFEHDEWGKFQVIGFMAEKYFAGYPDNEFTDDVSLLSDGQLSKVLIDDDNKKSLYTGSSLMLEEGYQLYVVEVDLNGNNVMVNLVKDGDNIDTGIISANDDYVYEMDIGSTDNVPVIVVHFAEIFRGTETNAVFVEGIFQISEDVIEIEAGERFGRMEIASFSENEITFENRDSVSLTRGNTISLMGDISFKVADSTDVRYYPFVEVSTLPSQSLSIDMPAVIRQNEVLEIEVTSRGAAVDNAVVMFGNIDIGRTATDGTVSYTPQSAGTFTVTAEKDGFVSASEKVEVISPEDATRKLVIEVSPETVVEGDDITISVMKAIGGDPVEGIQVYYDSNLIGSTDSDGMLTYNVKETGVHKLTSSSDEYLEAELNLEVLALEAMFSYSNLQVTPLLVKTGEDVTVTVDVMNTGTSAGQTDVQLLINGSVADSKSVLLDAGEETTVTFTVSEDEAGSYEVQISSFTVIFEVEKKFLPAPGIIVSMTAVLAVALLIRMNKRKD